MKYIFIGLSLLLAIVRADNECWSQTYALSMYIF